MKQTVSSRRSSTAVSTQRSRSSDQSHLIRGKHGPNSEQKISSVHKRSAGAKEPHDVPRMESTVESPREPGREMDVSLTAQPKMKISRKNEGAFREVQRNRSRSNSVNPATRR